MDMTTVVTKEGLQYFKEKMDDDIKDAVSSSVKYKGAWSSATTYAVNDLVTYNSLVYLCIDANRNQTPDSTSLYWINFNKGGGGTEGDYVTPEQFGAVADGVTDDSVAIQSAVNSGKDVVFASDKTYFVAGDKYIAITNKTNFHMYGGIIHKEAHESNYNLFVVTGCKDCSFSDMYIYSELTKDDILIPQDHQRPIPTESSNVLAFSGYNNSNIRFENNSFDYMSADYWLNASADKGFWENVTVDGWESHTSLMPMYAQCITGLIVQNADISMNPTHAGDGDHCIYICTGASKVRIRNSVFEWTGSNAVVCLTFHNNNPNPEEKPAPKDILVSDCTVNAGVGRCLYTGDTVTVNVDKCKLNYSTDDTASNSIACFGLGSFIVSDCEITGYGKMFDLIGDLTLNQCTITGGNGGNGIFGTAKNVICNDCEFSITGGTGILYFVASGEDVYHLYNDCKIAKAIGKQNNYLISKRSTDGHINFNNCNIDCGSGLLMYNGGSTDMTGVSLVDTTIANASYLSISAERTGYVADNSTLNGEALLGDSVIPDEEKVEITISQSGETLIISGIDKVANITRTGRELTIA